MAGKKKDGMSWEQIGEIVGKKIGKEGEKACKDNKFSFTSNHSCGSDCCMGFPGKLLFGLGVYEDNGHTTRSCMVELGTALDRVLHAQILIFLALLHTFI